MTGPTPARRGETGHEAFGRRRGPRGPLGRAGLVRED
jgi:hypothetical protein